MSGFPCSKSLGAEYVDRHVGPRPPSRQSIPSPRYVYNRNPANKTSMHTVISRAGEKIRISPASREVTLIPKLVGSLCTSYQQAVYTQETRRAEGATPWNIDIYTTHTHIEQVSGMFKALITRELCTEPIMQQLCGKSKESELPSKPFPPRTRAIHKTPRTRHGRLKGRAN